MRRARFGLLGLFALIALLRPLGITVGETPERYLYDRASRWLLPDGAMSDQIIVVEVDDRTLQQLGQRWPLSRQVWAEFLTRIGIYEPRLVALDVVFDQPSPAGELVFAEQLLDILPEEDRSVRPIVERKLTHGDPDRALSAAIAEAGNVILGAMLIQHRDPLSRGQDEQLMRPLDAIDGGDLAYRLPELTQSVPEIGLAARGHGLLNVIIDDDGRLRRYVFAGARGDRAYPSLGLAAVVHAYPDRADELVRRATAHDGAAPPLRLTGARDVDRVTFIDVLLATDESAGIRSALAGKIVFVGVTATGVPEQLITPLDIDTVGVQLHAMAASRLLAGELLRSRGAPAWLGALLALAIFAGLAVIAGRFRLRIVAAIAGAASGAYLVLFYLLYVGPGWVLPLAPVLLGTASFLIVELIGRFGQLSRERREILLAQQHADDKARFIATVTHELRTPLTSIRGSLGLLAGGAVDTIEGPAREMVGIAHTNTERLIRLVNDVLDLEKLSAGQMPFEREEVDVGELCAANVAANMGYAQELSVDVALDVEDGLRATVAPDRISQVLVNLLSNAIKFSPTGDTVELRARGEGDEIVIAVEDHGPGIPEEFRDKVFERFSQARSKQDRQRGTGLGLAIVEQIVSRHGGRVWFETETGKGTTFYVALPR